MTRTHAIFSPSPRPLFWTAEISIQIQKTNKAMAMGMTTAKRISTKIMPPMSPPLISANIVLPFSVCSSRGYEALTKPFIRASSRRLLRVLFVFARLILAHRLLERGHLFKQFLEFDAGEAFDHGRQLADDACHVAGELARAAARTAAGIDDDHLLHLAQRLAD